MAARAEPATPTDPAPPTAARSPAPPPPGEAARLPNAERPLTKDELLTVRGECTQNGCGSAVLVADTHRAAFWQLDPVGTGVRPYGLVFSTERSDVGVYGSDPLEVIDAARSMVCE